MQVVKKVVLGLLVILFSLAIFAPKRELFYLLEERLMQQDIIISNEEIDTGLFTLTLRHPELYFKGIKVADINEIRLFSLLFYTTAIVKGIKADASLQKWVPGEIDNLTAGFQLGNPGNIALGALGSFGRAEGYVSLNKRVVHIDLIEEKSIKALKPLLKKGEKGWYYEAAF
ncbi:MAG: hypothetical protein U9R26_07080 [Campylobacterota bacterium]|nr:hypothetical protein [Campylobacterota bacterium]